MVGFWPLRRLDLWKYLPVFQYVIGIMKGETGYVSSAEPHGGLAKNPDRFYAFFMWFIVASGTCLDRLLGHLERLGIVFMPFSSP